MNSSSGTDTIIQFDAEKFIAIDNNRKTYTEMTFAQLSEMVNKAAEELGGKSEEMAAAVKMMNMEMNITKVVTSIEKCDVPASVFEIPANYKRLEPNTN
jgi:hypothetical protein